MRSELGHLEALEAADQAARCKYATRALPRRSDALATFMAKPFGDQAGNSMHLHLSLWREDEPAFAPDGDAENELMRAAVGGILAHLPGIVGSLAPASATWGADNRTAAIRSLTADVQLQLEAAAAFGQS
ncbi:MAG: hypothetical protein ACXVW5_29690 [Solirubrobacteraceae bacterium]